MFQKVFFAVVSLWISSAVAIQDPRQEALIRYEYKNGEITKLCDETIAKTKKALDVVGALPEADRTIENTLLALEKITADFSEESNPLTFVGYVSTDEKLRAESSKCEEKLGQFHVTIGTRRDLYDAIRGQKAKNAEQARLLEKTIESFELNGLKLPDSQLEEVKKLRSELTKLETQYSTNLNNDKSTVVFTAEELEGVPESVLARFKKLSNGKYEVTTKSTDAIPVLENSVQSETRRKMSLAYLNRGGQANLDLLKKAVGLRAKVAKLMGYETWSDYRLMTRMAKDRKTVLEFLNSLKGKLAARNRTDMNKLLKFKQEIEPGAKELNSWDLGYLAYQLQKRDYQLDNEKIREYFPADTVVAGMFDVYSKMLGVTYHEVKGAKVWAEGVKLYEVRNKGSKAPIAYFFADFFPREGKYGHAAAFTLVSGRRMEDGKYNIPVASIVSNFTAPTADKPSLLDHDEVETAFHEFGHIMHQTLTRAPYASLSGAGVPWDFVEAPSQMLENWVWSKEILGRLSGHYQNPKRKLPPEMLKQMLKVKDFNQGVRYTRQLVYGLFDMTIHTSDGNVDPNEAYERLYREMVGVEPIPGGKFPANFGHMMGGYDSGYYGYLWSEVYAQDMFSKFPKSNLTSANMGGRYRRMILEQGNMKEPMDMLVAFLGRKPKTDAFFRELGIK